jgi:hypothetical protein
MDEIEATKAKRRAKENLTTIVTKREEESTKEASPPKE